MPEINTGTGATTNIPTAPAAAVTADNAPKTYSQTEYDAQLGAGRNEVYHALGVTAENAASEIEAFKAWKAQQTEQKAQQSQKPEPSAADESGKRLSEMENKLTAMQRKLDAVNAGVPTDKAERYVRLATSYMDDKTDFTAALAAALKDFPLPTIAPNSTRQFGSSVNGGGKTDKLKSASSKRDVPLNDTAVSMIQDLRAERYMGEDTPLVSDENGDYTRPVNFRKRYYRVLQAAGIETKGLHSLRHTFATNLVNGIRQPDGTIKALTPRQVADLLGHTTSQITEMYYVKKDTVRLSGITDDFNI